MKRRIGPLPLLGGLQTQPAEGKPTGMISMLNMEPRNGLCMTRRGGMPLMRLVPTGVASGGFRSPLDMTAATVGAWGLNPIDTPTPDSVIAFRITGGVDDFCDGGATWEFFGVDSAWHALEVMKTPDPQTDGWLFRAGLDSEFTFIAPFGWGLSDPFGAGSAYWIRMTRAATAGAFGTSMDQPLVPQAIKTSDAPPANLVYSPTTRAGRGPFAFQFTSYTTPSRVWSVVDVGRRTQTIPLSGAGVPQAFADDDVVAQYIPASDAILASLGSQGYTVISLDGPQGLVPVSTDERYADIGTETDLPPKPKCMAMFGKRVFIGGPSGDPTKIIWSAPGAFWQTWPSVNQARVELGQVIAMIPVHETLYIFTTRAIYRAVLGDPTAGNESNLFLDLVEEVPCLAGRTVRAVGGNAVIFLSADGVRSFNGTRSKLIMDDASSIFRPDSSDQFAVKRPATCHACWHPIENQYRMSYATTGALHNDTEIVIDLDNETLWVWGADPIQAIETGIITPSLGPIGQRARGIRATAMAWNPARSCIVAIDPEGIIFEMDSGQDDLGSKIRWYVESHNLRIAQDERATLERVEISVVREHFRPFAVSVTPDGDEARADTRTVGVESDGLNTSAAIDSASLAGSITPLQFDASIAPIRARFRKAGRNHRVRLAGVAPNYEPIGFLGVTVELNVDEKGR